MKVKPPPKTREEDKNHLRYRGQGMNKGQCTSLRPYSAFSSPLPSLSVSLSLTHACLNIVTMTITIF